MYVNYFHTSLNLGRSNFYQRQIPRVAFSSYRAMNILKLTFFYFVIQGLVTLMLALNNECNHFQLLWIVVVLPCVKVCICRESRGYFPTEERVFSLAWSSLNRFDRVCISLLPCCGNYNQVLPCSAFLYGYQKSKLRISRILPTEVSRQPIQYRFCVVSWFIYLDFGGRVSFFF